MVTFKTIQEFVKVVASKLSGEPFVRIRLFDDGSGEIEVLDSNDKVTHTQSFDNADDFERNIERVVPNVEAWIDDAAIPGND